MSSPQSSSYSSENRRSSNKRLNLDLNISHHDNDEEAVGSSLENELNRMNKKQKKLAEDLNNMRDNFKSLEARYFMTLKKKRKLDEVDHQCDSISVVSDHNSTKIMDLEQYCRYKKTIDHLDPWIKSPTDPLIDKTTVTRRIDPLNPTSLTIEDGYQWRKYGQKVTRDNPTPRAYYKCSFAPTCPVKKKVQRSLEDPSLLVAHYIGKHNHGPSNEPKAMLSLNPPTASTLTPKTPPPLAIRAMSCGIDMKNPDFELQRVLAKEMASSLIQNDSFTEALAAAISSRIWHY